MFCDLVGYTQLSMRLDPEELAEILQQYRATTGRIIERFGGAVWRYQGDGTLFCFGYPSAHDDDTIRAARAALEITGEVRALGQALHARLGCVLDAHVGIHTGEALVGGSVDPDPIVGQVTNIAARLQARAKAGEVLVSEDSARFLFDAFELERTGPIRLKGVDEDIVVYRLVRERDIQGTLFTFASRNLTPLTGRNEELALIMKSWGRVVDGHGQVQLISGEAGIGKSRLLHAVISRIPADARKLLVCTCLPHHAQSTLYPFVDLLRRELEFASTDSPERKREKLARAFESSAFPFPHMRESLGNLLLPAGATAAVAETSPKVRRERTIDWFVEWTIQQSQRQPLVLIIDDLHWADSYTLELVTSLSRRIAGARVFLLISFRTDFSPPLALRSEVGHVALGPLAHADVQEIIASIVAREEMPVEVSEHIVRMSDGVPLFVEEVVRAYTLHGRPALTPTLRGMFTARLDALSPEDKILVQTASVVGHEFPSALLEAIVAIEPERLKERLSRLLESETVYQRGTGHGATYVFRHALLATDAYISLPKPARAELHRRVAMAIQARMPTHADEHPEVVAMHLREGGAFLEAAEYWRRAGAQALEQSADTLAVGHLRHGLDCLDRLEPGTVRYQMEVESLVTLGAALTAVRGFGASDVEATYAQAHALCERLGDTERRFHALAGLHSFYQVRGPLTKARDIASELLALAHARDDSPWLAQAHRRLGWCLFCLGEMASGRAHLRQAIELYDSHGHVHARVHGAHPRVVGMVNLALVDWFMGDAALALRRSQEAIADARRLGKPFILAYALCMSAAVRLCKQEPDEALRLTAEVDEIATHWGFPYWLAWSQVLQGWALTSTGALDDGLARLQAGVDRYRETGAQLFLPWAYATLAECLLRRGQPDEARTAIVRAEEGVRDLGGYFLQDSIRTLRADYERTQQLRAV